MPFNRDWLIPDETGNKPAYVWLGELKALWSEGVRVIQQIEKNELEEGTGFTPNQRNRLVKWFDDWHSRLRNQVNTPPR